MTRSSSKAAAIALAIAGTAHGQIVVTNTYTNLDSTALVDVPVTFSRVAGDGDFTAGITPRVAGVALPAQVDVLRSSPDGSIRHALVSFVMPAVSAGGDVSVQWLNTAPATPPPFDWRGKNNAPLDLALELDTMLYGQIVSDIGLVISTGGWYAPEITVLHDGPVMKEFEYVEVPAGQPADQYVTVYWRLRVFSGQDSIRVSVTVENANPRASGTPTELHYDFWAVRLVHEGVVLYQEGPYDHVDQTRYRILEWTAGALENLHRKPNYDYLVRKGFFPPYKFTNQTSAQYRDMTLAKAESIFLARTSGRNDDVRDQGILEQGIIYDQMPGTGGRWDIGLYPAWTVAYLLTGAPGLYERILHADGNGGASYYIHVRDSAGAPGYNVLTLPPSQRPLSNPHRINMYQFTHQPDHAHAPSLGYLGYIMTGDTFYAEEMSFWASYQLGEWPYIGMDINAPERAQAWGLRHVVDAAFLVPDSNPLLGYFQGRLDAYATTLQTQFVQSNRPLHYFKEQGRASGRLEWVNAYFCSPWQASWLLSSVGNAINKGTPAFEGFRDWLGEYIIGFYTSYHDPAHDFVGPDGVTYKYDPKDAMPYSMATSLWQCEVYTDDNGTAADASDDFLATRKLFKIKDFTNYGEIWYYNKVNQDNEWSQYTSSPGVDPAMLPDANCENWPIRPDGWGHGFVYQHLSNPPRQGNWYGWHRYGAWDGLVAAIDGDTTGAPDAWNEMTALAGQADYGYEMQPMSHYIDGGPPTPTCPPGEIEDCAGNCFPVAWLGDGFCNAGTTTYGGNPIDLDCAALNFDGGDCAQTPASNIVWQHANGQTYVWQMLGTDLIGQGSPGRVNPDDWDLVGLGDFDGDGDSDILWRHQATGQTYIWLLDGTERVGHGSPGAANPNDWDIVGIGDFDALATTATSTDDILWRHTTTGQTVVWLLDGVQRIGQGSPGRVPVGDWNIADVGDFDGDSHADILWRNTVTGLVYMWFVNGTQRIGQAAAGTANPNDWQILGVGDFDADATTATRTDDILWGNPATGQIVIWLMDGGQRIGQGTLGTVNLAGWVMADVGDLDGDGRADLLWRHSTGGFIAVWFVDGLTVLPNSAALLRVVDQDWTIVGIAEQQ